ncbi:YHS domain-containing protein [Haloferax chudinovii]|uniref:YHS domain-containing protein n=1 Tax=Haloferax chudinovii TaxID=1109010 RepID=A0ABD5XM27_9EURY
MPIDPVCGMELSPSDAVSTVQHGRTTYYFCSEECQQRFEEQPTIYTE